MRAGRRAVVVPSCVCEGSYLVFGFKTLQIARWAEHTAENAGQTLHELGKAQPIEFPIIWHNLDMGAAPREHHKPIHLAAFPGGLLERGKRSPCLQCA